MSSYGTSGLRAEVVRREKEEAERRATVLCPICGRQAEESRTQYGIRSSCCGLWSYDRLPLVDKATHDARKSTYLLLRDVGRSIGTTEVAMQVKKRCGVPELSVRNMNEATCKKVMSALEDILVDVVAGTVKMKDKR